jgi:hypothetical protein
VTRLLVLTLLVAGCASSGPRSFECIMMDHTCNDPDPDHMGRHVPTIGQEVPREIERAQAITRQATRDQALARCQAGDASSRAVLEPACRADDEDACACLGWLAARSSR